MKNLLHKIKFSSIEEKAEIKILDTEIKQIKNNFVSELKSKKVKMLQE